MCTYQLASELDDLFFIFYFGQVGGAGILVLYVVQCAIGSWVHRIPAERRTGAHGALLAGLGATIVLLAFVETWLGLVSAGHNTLVWSVLLFVSFSFSLCFRKGNAERAKSVFFFKTRPSLSCMCSV